MRVYRHPIRDLAECREKQARHDAVVLETICRLGGVVHMRVMEFRKHIPEPLREVQIKDALKRLTENGLIEMVGERHDSRGNKYRITKEAL
jgi:hypothetical protein